MVSASRLSLDSLSPADLPSVSQLVPPTSQLHSDHTRSIASSADMEQVHHWQLGTVNALQGKCKADA